jgi:hypothetical protein
VLVGLWAGGAAAVQTQVVRTDGFAELAPGELRSVSLSDLGRLSLAPAIKGLPKPDVEVIWSMTLDPNGRLYCGTGHDGRILAIDSAGTTASVFLNTSAPEITALLYHNDKLYAASAPDGKLLVCDPPGTTTVVFETGEKYIWDMVVDPKGNILLATGPKGKIFRYDLVQKKGEVLFDAPDENVLGLAFDGKGRLYAGTQGKGRVYRWEDGRTSPVVLFEAPSDEIRRIALDRDGRIYAAVNSEVISRRMISAIPSGAMPGRGPGGPGGPSEGPGEGLPSGPPSAMAPRPGAPPTPVGRSDIYLIEPEGFVRLLWNVSEAPVHDIAYDADRDSLLIAAGNKGKIFRLDARGNYQVVSSLEQEQVVVLHPAGKQTYIGTVGPTALYVLGDRLAAEGTYLSPALNAGSSVRWGSLRREGVGVENIAIDTRSGNTAEPDATWYDWTPVKWNGAPTEGRIQSPVARYIQWRARFAADRGDRPNLDYVEVFYASQNERPVIRTIAIRRGGVAAAAAATAASAGPGGPRPPSMMPPSGPPAGPGRPGGVGTNVSVPERSNPERFEISWQVDDPNNDTIESALYFKGEEEKVWKLIKDELTEAKYSFPTGTIPDGAYRVRVVVSDRPSNFGPQVRRDELVSERFVVDNTAPQITSLKATAVGDGQWQIEAVVSDTNSIIADAKFNIDGQEWHVLVPTDGLFDERTENLTFFSGSLKGEEHILGLVVTDREGNSAVGKLVLRP